MSRLDLSVVVTARNRAESLPVLLGRLELFTLLIFLRPEFWRAHRNW